MKVKVCFMLIGVFTYMQPVYSQVTGTLSTFEGREGYTLKNSQMRITILTGGAYIAELGLLSPEAQQSINPLFIPHYRTIDPHTYTPEKHQQFYGIGRNAKLMAGYMGHYLCFPYFGEALQKMKRNRGTPPMVKRTRYNMKFKKRPKKMVPRSLFPQLYPCQIMLLAEPLA